ncbi:MAG TPA: hypothetical protein PKA05_03595 [Roseiflexaceae bacterium]|nr:hypothetical protein [Roseiflexaceae bacterium]HMP39442.1 hypothetical protein [Roseiflexaceae bacterium]
MLEHDLYAAHERYQAMRRAAAEAQRLAQAQPEPAPTTLPRWRWIVDHCGRWLIAWGWWLRVRSGSVEGSR